MFRFLRLVLFTGRVSDKFTFPFLIWVLFQMFRVLVNICRFGGRRVRPLSSATPSGFSKGFEREWPMGVLETPQILFAFAFECN